MTILITGSNGLIGSTAAHYFLKLNHKVIGLDNNMRKRLFGLEGDTSFQCQKLQKNDSYTHYHFDIRKWDQISSIFTKHDIDAVIHTAAQPSHDKAQQIPMLDFEINTTGTLNLLEATRKYQPNATFIFTSTNKVYGDNPNKIPLKEKKNKYVYADHRLGIDESCSIDQNLHSLFGASKTAADIYVQEYGRYFGLKTSCLRLGCVTGSTHAGVKLHGFLSFLVKSLIHNNQYEIIGYKGKQVRDQIHADDVVAAMNEIIKNPNQGEVFNLGGGHKNSASIKELIKIISKKINKKSVIDYNKNNRKGDHIVYITDFSKFSKYYPNWKLSKNLDDIIDEIIKFELSTNKHRQ